MGREVRAKWYNRVYKRVRGRSLHSSWDEVYATIISYLPNDQLTRILDIGCGCGEMASRTYKARYQNYIGVDFSEVAIRQAKERVPQFKFLCEDVFNDKITSLFESSNVIVALDFLEHIKNDILLIKKIPTGKQVIFMVPTFDYASHVRYFQDFQMVLDRYGELLEFKDVMRKMGLDPNKVSQFLVNSVKR